MWRSSHQVEEFEQADAVGGAVGPRGRMGGPIDKRADGLLPFVVFVEMLALKIIAAGKAEEGGMEGGELLHQIDALAVRLIIVGGRKERNQLEPCGPGMLHEKLEMIGGRGREVAGL